MALAPESFASTLEGLRNLIAFLEIVPRICQLEFLKTEQRASLQMLFLSSFYLLTVISFCHLNIGEDMISPAWSTNWIYALWRNPEPALKNCESRNMSEPNLEKNLNVGSLRPSDSLSLWRSLYFFFWAPKYAMSGAILLCHVNQSILKW